MKFENVILAYETELELPDGSKSPIRIGDVYYFNDDGKKIRFAITKIFKTDNRIDLRVDARTNGVSRESTLPLSELKTLCRPWQRNGFRKVN